jgi:4-carboxymuconolactone decarboxylase
MTDQPRIDPLAPGEWRDDVGSILEAAREGTDVPLGSHNIFRTLARHPDLFRSWLPFAGYLLAGGTLPARDRELLILRTAVRCGSSYEWGQHVRISLGIGIEREAIDRVVAGPAADGWTDHEAALLRAVDELHERSTVPDATWEALAREYDQSQLIEATMLVGHYHMVAFVLRAARVQLDDGLESLPGDDQVSTK